MCIEDDRMMSTLHLLADLGRLDKYFAVGLELLIFDNTSSVSSKLTRFASSVHDYGNLLLQKLGNSKTRMINYRVFISDENNHSYTLKQVYGD